MKDIIDLIEKFNEYIGTKEGEEWKNDRIDRKKFYSNSMSKDHLKSLTEEEFRTAIKSLWATGFWTNKDWKVNDTLKQNGGVERIREHLFNLFYGAETLHKRYDDFREKIKGIGPSMLTELMAFTDPKKYCIWNEKPKAVLPFLKIDNLLPDRVFKYQITGKEYESCNNVLSKIKEELGGIITNPDFIDVDFFLAFIFYNILPTEPEIAEEPQQKDEIIKAPSKSEISDHTTAQRTVIELGNLLGFDTYLPPEDRGKIDIATLRDIPQFTYPHLLDTVKHIVFEAGSGTLRLRFDPFGVRTTEHIWLRAFGTPPKFLAYRLGTSDTLSRYMQFENLAFGKRRP